jgi:hypothetical protein
MAIVQVEGHECLRVPARLVPGVLDTLLPSGTNSGVDVYVVDAHGNTWAPAYDTWVLWEAGPAWAGVPAFDVEAE